MKKKIPKTEGKLGVLFLDWGGAVSTTFIAGLGGCKEQKLD